MGGSRWLGERVLNFKKTKCTRCVWLLFSLFVSLIVCVGVCLFIWCSFGYLFVCLFFCLCVCVCVCVVSIGDCGVCVDMNKKISSAYQFLMWFGRSWFGTHRKQNHNISRTPPTVYAQRCVQLLVTSFRLFIVGGHSHLARDASATLPVRGMLQRRTTRRMLHDGIRTI